MGRARGGGVDEGPPRDRHDSPPARTRADAGVARLRWMSVEVDSEQVAVDPGLAAEWMAQEGGPQVVDVREPYEREAGHIEGSVHIALTELPARAGELERERPVLFYCRVGARSDMAAQAFRASGFQAHSLRGGLVRWAREGRPLAPAGGSVADH